MPVINGTGCSAETPRKHRDLELALKVWFAIAAQVAKKHGGGLTVIDATCGPGIYPCDSCEDEKCEKTRRGSPLVILDILRRREMPARVMFIDSEKTNIETLQNAVPDHPAYIQFECGRYQDVLGSFTAPGYGLLLIDENGVLDFDFVKSFYERNSKTIDVLLNIPCTATKRGAGEHKRIDEYLREIPKHYWAIRQVRGRGQWTQMFGTNWKTLIRKLEGYNENFYGTDTMMGKTELERVSCTADELNKKKDMQIMLNI
jgi:three-Cys-motif partner protein